MIRGIPKTAGAVTALSFILLTAPAPAAQVDYFLKIPGVEGESKTQGHERQIEILSYDWGATRDSALSMVDAGKVTVHKMPDRASPSLVKACLTGRALTSASLVAEKPTSGKPIPYLRYKLERCFVTSFQLSGGAAARDGSIPMDSFSLNFSKIEYEYTRHDDSTSQPLETITGGFDVESGTFLSGTTGVSPAWFELR